MTSLRPFQLEGVRQIYRFKGRAILADEMGLGKTLQVLYWLNRITNCRPAVIVAPATVKYVWQAEAALHLGMRVEVLEGKPDRVRELPSGIVVLNYDILGAWLPSLLQARPQAVVFDEAHYIKSMTAQRTKHALRLVRYARSVIAVSGTPLTNRPIELWPILRAVRPNLFSSLQDFAWEYCAPRWTFWGWRYDGAANTKKLNRILTSSCMIRRTKKQVLHELPRKSRQMVPFKLDKQSMKEYREARDNFIEWLQKQSPMRAKRAQRAKELARLGYLIRLAARLKLEWTKKWIEQFLETHPGRKLVAFSMHTSILQELKEHFGKRALLIDGSVKGPQRTEAVRLFRTNPKRDLMFGNWKAAGVGITLVAASDIASLDFPWTPGDLLQGEDRIHRIGQKHPVTAHYLVALGTVEEHQIDVLLRKSRILNAVLDGRRTANDLDIFSELLSRIKK